MIYNKKITLNNGVDVPQLGFGTWLIDDGKVAEKVKNAVEIGYRHIDTAQAYANERGVGEGVRECGLRRDELFVTTKVAAEHKTYAAAAKSIDESLKTSGLDYFDLMIIHSPQPWVEVNQSADRHFIGNVEAWRALEDAYKAGKIRAIGVSNFLQVDIENILANCTIKPMVNQVLMHIGNTPKELIDYCQAQNIAVEAYSPIGHGEILKNSEIVAMAKKYGVTVPQICVRYTLQLGAISLPKAENYEHMKLNADVNFEISDEDMKKLLDVERVKDYGESSFFPVYGGKM